MSQDTQSKTDRLSITEYFQCGGCRQEVDIERMGEILTCPNCDCYLQVPRLPRCPKCDSRSTKLLSREEQSSSNTGKIAGVLLGGIAGLFAGSVVDKAKKEIKRSVTRAKYSCNECSHTFAVSLPVINPDENNILPIVEENILLSNVGIETMGSSLTVLLQAGIKAPCKYSQTVSTSQDNQDTLTMNVFEGYAAQVEGCNKIGTFDITGIPSAPAGIPMIDLSFTVSSEGIFDLTACGHTEDMRLQVVKK